MRRLRFRLATLFLVASANSSADARFETQALAEFSPANDETFDFPLKLDAPTSLRLSLYSPDDHVVRVIESDGELAAGAQTIEWDGRDGDGDIVPDEAYVPVLEYRATDGTSQTLDPRKTGGETIAVPWSASENGVIVYELEQPGRVLVRLGVKAGQMLRSLMNWEPRPAGRNVVRWDGFDADRLIDLRSHPKLSVLVTAFRLPDHAVIAHGNDAESYRDYLSRKSIPTKTVPIEERVLARGDARISVHHYLSRAVDVDPRVSLEFVGEHAGEDATLSKDEAFEVKVDIHADDQWAMAQNLHDVAFFIDDEFIAEEGHGYVPINWRFKPTLFDAGKHRLTVNISGFTGQVGVASIAFEIKDED